MAQPPQDEDLVERYFKQGWTDGLPVAPPTPEKISAMVEALGGDPSYVEARIPPRRADLTREVLAINAVMAGCQAEYAPVVRAALVAMGRDHFNLNGIQATTHMAAPLVVVNGPLRHTLDMNMGCSVFGPGNRANATIGRAIRLVLHNVGGGVPGVLDQSTLGHPGKYTFCIAEHEEASPWPAYHVDKGYGAEDSTVFCIAAEAPHSVTNHISDDPEGILDSIASAMRTIAHKQCRQQWVVRSRDRSRACRNNRGQAVERYRQYVRRADVQRAIRHDLQPELVDFFKKSCHRGLERCAVNGFTFARISSAVFVHLKGLPSSLWASRRRRWRGAARACNEPRVGRVR